MMRQIILMMMLTGVLLSLGCVSSPAPRYYTLDMAASGHVRSRANVTIEVIEVAEALQRDAIIILSSPTSIEYYAADQWASGLHELVRQKLEAELEPAEDDAPRLALHVYVRFFGQVDTDHGPMARAVLHVETRIPRQSRYEEPLTEREYTVEQDADDDSANSVVAALSRCLEKIALYIARDSIDAIRLCERAGEASNPCASSEQ